LKWHQITRSVPLDNPYSKQRTLLIFASSSYALVEPEAVGKQ
jgi:hypothetical protein